MWISWYVLLSSNMLWNSWNGWDTGGRRAGIVLGVRMTRASRWLPVTVAPLICITQRRLMQPYEAQRKSYVVFLINTLTATPGMARKAAYAYNLLLPGKNYMRGSGYKSHQARWRHAGRAAIALLVGHLRRPLRRNRAAAPVPAKTR
jgi:hypothetical protein